MLIPVKINIHNQVFESPEIEFQSEIGVIDLHNFADFKKFVYDANKEMSFFWVEHKKGYFKLGVLPVGAFKLVFSVIQELFFQSGDNDLPHSESLTLEHYILHKLQNDRFKISLNFANHQIVSFSFKEVVGYIYSPT